MFGWFGKRDEGKDTPRPGADEQGLDDGFNMSALTEQAQEPAAAGGAPAIESDPLATLELKPKVVEAISAVFDPEIPVNIYELGLVYDVVVGGDRRVLVKMTLTSPNCPSAQSLPSEVRYRVKAVPGVTDAHVEIVWEPPWTMEKMSDVARLQLGLM